MRTKLFLALVLFASVRARANVFGADRRVFATPMDFPAVGRVHHRADLRKAARSICTGTLVHERYVLTAAHCIARVDSLTLNPNVPTVFELAQGFESRAVRVWSGEWEGERSPRDGDWAILELESAVPTDVAKPLAVLGNGMKRGARVVLPGFSLDRAQGRQLSVDRACRVRSVVNPAVFHHDCDAFAGASGGPILIKTKAGYAIAGIHNSHKSQGTRGLMLSTYSPNLTNIGATTHTFHPTFEKVVGPHLAHLTPNESPNL